MIRPILKKIAILSLLLISVIATAADNISLTSSIGGTVTTAIPGATSSAPAQVDFKASSPVAGANTISQTLQANWDSTRLPLKSLSSIIYPDGWNLNYSVDGGANWLTTAPNNISTINAIKTTGTLVSLGEQNGKQIVQGNGSAVSPAPPAQISSSINQGDGWNVFFNPSGTRAYNIFHHSAPAKIDCHIKSTGLTCPGFPADVPAGYTNNRSHGYVTNDGRIFIPGGLGFSCLTEAGIPCTGTGFVNGVYKLTTISVSNSSRTPVVSEADNVLEIAVANNKLYTLFSFYTASIQDSADSELLCFDLSTNSACLENGSKIGLWGPYYGNIRMASTGNLVFVYGQGTNYVSWKLACIDASSGSTCSGWATPKTITAGGSNEMVILPNASGQATGVCILSPRYTPKTQCFDLTGNSLSAPATLDSMVVAMEPSNSTYNFSYANTQTLGTRVYFSNANWQGTGLIGCWDASASGNKCWTNWTFVSSGSLYTVNLDPYNPNCIWTNSNSNGINTWDATGPTPVLGCSTVVPIIDFPARTNGVRMGCSASNPISSWISFVFSKAPTSASTVTLTVLDSNGAFINGWKDVSANLVVDPSCTGCKKANWDLSALTIATTGQNPSFRVAVSGVAAGTVVGSALTAVGNSPELCWSSQASAGCPVISGLGVAAANNAQPTMTAPTSTLVNADGSYTSTGGNALTNYVQATKLMTQGAPSANACYGTISGYARKNASTTGLAGLTVNLVDAAGSPITFNGNAVTTTTAADGSYTFNNLYPNDSIASPTTSQQYAVTFSVPTGYTFVGNNKTAISSTLPTTFTTGQTSSTNVTPFVAIPPVGATAPPAGQLSASQQAVVSAFYTPPPQVLSISKVPNAVSFTPVSSTTVAGLYTVSVSNAGTSPTTGKISFTDQLPPNMTATSGGVASSQISLVSGSTTGWSCSAAAADANGQLITCVNSSTPTGSTFTALDSAGTASVKYNVYISSTDLTRTYLNKANLISGLMGGDTRTPTCSTMTAPSLPSVTPVQSSDGLCTQALVGVQAQVSLSKAVTSVVRGATTYTSSSLPAGVTSLATMPLAPSDKVVYTITAVNNSSTTAVSNLNLTETVPTETTYTGTTEGWSCALNSVAGTSCTQTIASMAASASATKAFTVTVGAAPTTSISNTVSSTSTFAACTGSNGSGCTATNPIAPVVKVVKVLTDASGNALGGANVSQSTSTYFKVTVSNTGGSATAGALTFTDTLPVGLSYNSTTSATGGFACAYVSGTRVLTCTSSTALAAGASASVVYKADIAANATTGNKVNSVIMTAMGGDPRTPSNSGLVANTTGVSTNGTAAQALINVTLPASLTVSKTLTNISRGGTNITSGLTTAQIKTGDILTYTISAVAVTGSYTGVVLTEALSANATYTGSGTDGTWSQSGSNYTQSIDVAAGNTLNKTFTVTVGALPANVSTLGNSVTATNPSGSANPSTPICSSCSTSNPTPPQIQVIKSGPGAMFAGGIATYSIRVKNVGGSATSGTLQINDTLPVGSLNFNSLVSASTTGGFTTSTSAGSTSVVFTTSTGLAAGASATITYKVNVDVSATAPIINQAALDATNKGGDPRTPDSTGLLNLSGSSAPASSNSTDATNSSTATPLTTGNPGVTKVLTSITRGATTYNASSGSFPAGVSGFASMPTVAGDVLVYTITATEMSTTAASAGTVIHETVPSNTHYSGTSEGWTVQGADYSWTTGTINAGASLTKTFTVTVDDAVTIGVTNTATTSSPGVCLGCEVVTPTAPKLSFSNEFTATTVTPGGSVSLIAKVTNNGGSATNGNITFTETLPIGLTLSGGSHSSNTFTCTANNTTPQVVTCSSTSSIPSGLANGVNVVLPLTAANSITGNNLNAKLAATSIANDPRTVPGSCVSACSVSDASVGANASSSTSQNTSSGSGLSNSAGLFANAAINTVQGSVTTTKTLHQIVRGGNTISADTSSVVRPGDQLVYKVVVAETAGQYAATTTLTETVPANTTYTGTNEGWASGCAAATSTCTQSVTVLANTSTSVFFTVTAASSFAAGVTSVENTVASSANPSCTSCSVTNQTPPLISIAKTAGQASIASLSTGTFTVAIANGGGTATSGTIKFSDTLPSGLTYLSATGTNYSCSASGQVVTCDYTGTIAAGGSASVTYTVRATGTAAAGKINSVIVDPAYMGGDVRTNNDTSSSAVNPTSAGNSTVSSSGLSAKARIDIATATTSAISGKAKKVGGGAVRGQAGITVKLKDSNGQPVLDVNNQAITSTTDANGDYQFFGLTPGQTYGVAFEPPAGTATAAPENSGGTNGTASGSAITAITVPSTPGEVPNQNAVIVDPSGVIYNSQTRQAISGAAVWIIDPSGNKVADTLLDTTYGTANGALTGSNGSYKLYLKDTSPTGTYSVIVVPPGCNLSANAPYSVTCPPSAAYQTSDVNGTSSLIPAQGGAYTPALGGGVENIQSQSTLPTGTQATTYYTSFAFTFSQGSAAGTSNGVANNHIPIDPVASLTISKTALTGLVPTVPTSYTVNVSNSATGGTAPGATVLEKIPAGLSLNNIGGTGWTCTKQDGTALNYPVAGEVIAKCTSATPIAPGANANAITVSVTPDASVINQTVYTYSSVDPTGNNSPPTPGTSCSPTNACASNTGSVSSGSATLFLQKMVSATTAELGDSVMYTLKLEHKVGSPQSGVKIVDTLPLGFKYIAGTVKMLRSGSVSTTTTGDAAMGVTGAGPVLDFTIGTMAQGDVATITYRVRLAVGSQQGTGINRATASTSTGFSSNEARATVKVTNGVFAQEGCIIGKVYLDCNHNGIQDQEDGDEPGVGGVRFYMEDGTYMVSDRQGKYSICGVSAMTHVLKVDKTTLPPGAELGITANRNALDPDSLFVDLKFGELHRADFLINNCTTDVLNEVDARQDKSGAPMGTYPQKNNKQPTKSQSFSLKEQRAKQRFYREGK